MSPQVAPTAEYEPPQAVNNAPAANTPTAVAKRPTLKAMPLPAARTRVGNNSGRYNGSQPKKSVATNPWAKTTGRNDTRNGAVPRNMVKVSTVAPRLMTA